MWYQAKANGACGNTAEIAEYADSGDVAAVCLCLTCWLAEIEPSIDYSQLLPQNHQCE